MFSMPGQLKKTPAKPEAILPGATIGCLGGGQLGRMFALSARKMGYRVHTVDPQPDSPTGQVSDREYNVPFTDIATLTEFARGVDVVTYEFENIPVEALDALAPRVKLRPGRDVLYTTQNRLREKQFLSGAGFPVAPFRVVQSESELRAAVAELGCPCVLKTADFGYDGKGQQKITYQTDLGAVWKKHGLYNGVLEAWVPFAAELSVVVGRGMRINEFEEHEAIAFPPTLNDHENHILATSVAPAPLADSILARAQSIGLAIAKELNVIGLIAWRPPRERARAAAPQLRPLQLRRLRHQPVRAATARRLRPAARRHAPALARHHAQPPRRRLVQRHAGLEQAPRAPRPAPASLRQERAPRRPQNGPLLRPRRDPRPRPRNRRAGAEDFAAVISRHEISRAAVDDGSGLPCGLRQRPERRSIGYPAPNNNISREGQAIHLACWR
jgi:hypothetical protein